MKPLLLGYCDNDSVRPGERVGFKVSCEGAETFRADIVRLICCETAPAPPGFKERWIETPANGDYPARRQEIPIGSSAVVPGPEPFNRLSSFTVQTMVWPTRPGHGRQALMGTWSAAEISGYAMHGATRNLPMRGATGWRWTGTEWAWTHAPEQYGAIHFHADDLYDAGWDTDFTFTVPAELASGIYAARLRADKADANYRARVTSIIIDRVPNKLSVVDDTDLLMLERPERWASPPTTVTPTAAPCATALDCARSPTTTRRRPTFLSSTTTSPRIC